MAADRLERFHRPNPARLPSDTHDMIDPPRPKPFLRLLCGMGWHVAEPGKVWNHGYYFSRCKGCGRDLIRTGSGPWHVPHGYKVVWRPRSRDRIGTGRPEPEPMTRRTKRSKELPIQAVLRQLRVDFIDGVDDGPSFAEEIKLPVRQALERVDTDVSMGDGQPAGTAPATEEQSEAEKIASDRRLGKADLKRR